MSFKQSFRMERIYFEKLKSNIPIIKSLLEQAQTEEARTLLMNSIDVDGAVLLLYRNLGEAWAELADLIQKTQKDLKDLSDRVDQYHDELNEKIDEVNNYLMRLIRALEDRIDVIEQRLDEIRDFYIITGAYDDKTGSSNYHMKHNGERIYLADVNAAITAGRTPVFIYTESVGVKEVYYFCKQSGAGTAVTFESIQTRFNSDTSSYETFNGKWVADGNFAHFSTETLCKTVFVHTEYDGDEDVWLIKDESGNTVTYNKMLAWYNGNYHVIMQHYSDEMGATLTISDLYFYDPGFTFTLYDIYDEEEGSTYKLAIALTDDNNVYVDEVIIDVQHPVVYLDVIYDNGTYSLEEHGESISYTQIKRYVKDDYVIILRYDEQGGF